MLYHIGMNKIFLIAALILVTGCSAVERVYQPDTCRQIGCGGDVAIYPHEKDSAITLTRRWYGVNGELPSDYPVGSAERRTLRNRQIEKLRSMGLDPQGRPLTE
jgi:hypothetical protein